MIATHRAMPHADRSRDWSRATQGSVKKFGVHTSLMRLAIAMNEERKGVLLLTTRAGLQQQPKLQKTLVPKLVQQGFCGIVLQVSHYFKHMPEITQQQGNELGLPIIETPPDVLFIQITEEILKRLVNQQYDLQQQSAQFNQKLTNLVLQLTTKSARAIYCSPSKATSITAVP